MAYELTLAMNLRTKAITQYKGYEANSVITHAGKAIGATDNGLKLLGADYTTDAGDAIDWHISVGPHDFNSEYKKRLNRVYSDIQTSGVVIATIDTEQNEPLSYVMKADSSSENTPTPHIAIPHRSHKGKMYKLTLSNQSKTHATIASITAFFRTLNTHVTGRS